MSTTELFQCQRAAILYEWEILPLNVLGLKNDDPQSMGLSISVARLLELIDSCVLSVNN